MNVRLRPYQIDGINDIEKAWETCNSVLFQMPTGTGKTTLFCEIARKYTEELYPNKKVLIVTHRKELVEQAFNRLVDDFHLRAGVIAAAYVGNQSSPIQVASIQTLVRRPEYQEDDFSLVIIDEAHHALANTYKKLWDFYPSSKFLGVTATPVRTNGAGFDDLFDRLITTPSVKSFIQNKHLSDVRYFASHIPDLSNIRLKAGDYDETELSEVMQDSTVMADLVQSYRTLALGKKMIVFAVNRAHCAKIVEKFNANGFPAKAIDTYTTTVERNAIVTAFRNNEFKILCNVNIFTEGFDCPDVDAVQLARPTKSLTLFLQQVGRCMRPHEGKPYGIVLDNAGLWQQHGLPKMNRNWSLHGTENNFCPTQKFIVGIKDGTASENEPQESKSIQLVEISDLEENTSTDTHIIDFNDIEKKLTNSKIQTMRERIEALLKKIQETEQRKSNETDEEFIMLFEEKIKQFQKELSDLYKQLQPQRFEQILDLMKEHCQEFIDINDIFVDGDKDAFLQIFVEPALNRRQNGSFGQDNSVIEPIKITEQRIRRETPLYPSSEEPRIIPLQRMQLINPKKGVIAHGYLLEDGKQFLVEAGSTVSYDTSASFQEGKLINKKLRMKFQAEGLISAERIFISEQKFSSISQAASIILGNSTNGYLAWQPVT